MNRRLDRPATRFVVAIAACVALAAACSRPQRAPARTLDSPSALAAVRYCERQTGGGLIYEAADACTADDVAAGTASVVTRVAIANSGNRFVHVLDTDLLRPRLVDFRLGVPGNTGAVVADGPTDVVALAGSALVLVASEVEPALSLVDVAAGAAVGEPASLPAPAHALRQTDDGTVVFAAPSIDALIVGRVAWACGGDEGVHRSNCAMTWTWTEHARVDVGGPISDLVVDRDGGAWISIVDSTTVERWAVAPPLLDDACAGTPCQVARASAGPDCSNGIDDDGDGLVDANDPQCFGPFDAEDGVDDLGRTYPCSNGIDDDGDGSIDADDDGCDTPDDASELALALGDCENGADDDLDGLVDGADPDCAASAGVSELAGQTFDDAFAANVAEPGCSDGLDGDGDGLVDWPADTDCYGPRADDESAPAARQIAALALTAEGDLLAAVDATTPEVTFIDTATAARVHVTDGDLLRAGAGVALPSRAPTVALASDVVVFDDVLDDGTTLVVTDRVVHVAVTTGIAYTVDLDRTFVVTDPANGETLVNDRQALFRRRDVDGNAASVGPVTCSIPAYIFDVFRASGLACDDPRFPSPAVLDAEALTGDVTDYTLQPGGAYVGLPQRTSWALSEETGGIEPTSIPDDYAVAEDRWLLTWEGELPRSSRDDALVVDDGGWIEFLGADPCALGQDVCSIGLDFSECPVAAELCSTGASLCGGSLDLCTVCPSVCRAAIDLCDTGVVPGDILEVDRISAAGLDVDLCADFVRVDDATQAADPTLVEFRIVEVLPNAVRVEAFTNSSTPQGRRVQTVPSSACFQSPFRVSVRAGESWVLRGEQRWGHRGPTQAVGGACVPRGDSDLRRSRPLFGEDYVSPWGFSFRIESGTEPPLRDFQLQFSIDSAFNDRTASSRQFILGPSTSAAVEIETARGRRIVFADDAQSYVWVYSAESFREVDAPLP